jgi:response regulator NasT
MHRVLIAEDEVMLAFTLRTQLERSGFEVVGVARTGKEAVEFNRAERPDIILMDIRMPEMDGIEATRRIMAEQPTCIVILSALAEKESVERASKAGAKGYLMKPAGVDAILHILQTTLSEGD